MLRGFEIRTPTLNQASYAVVLDDDKRSSELWLRRPVIADNHTDAE
jgi:hypothetical protein